MRTVVTGMTDAGALDPEDAKLVTLARGARGRISAAQGAAVRDEMGRTYAGASVTSGALVLTALGLAVAQAIAAGARGLECAVICGEPGIDDRVDAVRGLAGPGVPIILVGPDGAIRDRVTT